MAFPDLTSFKALSFDCYGTLIQWEQGLRSALTPISARLPSNTPEAKDPVILLQRFDTLSAKLQVAEPKLRYNINLSRSFATLASELNVSVSDEEVEKFGTLPGTWPPFPDTNAGLEILKKHYKLIILSNIDADNIAGSVKQFSPVEFDGVYIAQEIGSYKPSHRNFEYLFKHAKEELGVDREKGELLHVARSLTADHVPSKELGLRSVWISRGGETKEGEGVGGDYERLKGDVGFEWRFDTIGDFAKEVDRQFREKSG
ncbi:haloacid dehalogenase [Colletotrichum gloeosporioides Cg-14]|uniref:Haloacid dehalogenase n=1 Tax=Colletotrichum gloeosporioides (strain Cg-14) TaxID=1237896 RepID=T0M7T5_COLGC|nr:haloacid dehalogenase [Colletotrichum gloeosporioides Cg-14]